MVSKFLQKINIRGILKVEEPMRLHTSFEVGGPADVYVEPNSVEECIETIRLAKECGIPYIVLGAGSNVLVADEGIEGVVISTAQLCSITITGDRLIASAGATIQTIVEASSKKGMGGLEFLSGMPGSVGGAVWMNARCYGSEIADVLETVAYLDEALQQNTLVMKEHRSSFGYKRSPFQGRAWTILSATFCVHAANPAQIQEKIVTYQKDREKKGHYLAPCAGSVFKNDRFFGAPAGMILDQLGFKGQRIGDAEVSPIHANIVLNRGTARARDIRSLIEKMQDAVKRVYGRSLEPEILFIGRWESLVEKNREARK